MKTFFVRKCRITNFYDLLVDENNKEQFVVSFAVREEATKAAAYLNEGGDERIGVFQESNKGIEGTTKNVCDKNTSWFHRWNTRFNNLHKRFLLCLGIKSSTK